MKNLSFLTLLMALSVVALTFSNCEMNDEPEESCAQEEICPTKNVTACCDDSNTCTYNFNGKTYAENELSQLLDDLGCASNARLAADAAEAEANQLATQLENLIQSARARLNK